MRNSDSALLELLRDSGVAADQEERALERERARAQEAASRPTRGLGAATFVMPPAPIAPVFAPPSPDGKPWPRPSRRARTYDELALILGEQDDAQAAEAWAIERGEKGLEAAGAQEHQPLHLATMHGRSRAASKLLAHGANIDARDARGITPAMWAALGGHADCLRTLLASCAFPDIRLRDHEGRTALDWARASGHAACIEILEQFEAGPSLAE